MPPRSHLTPAVALVAALLVGTAACAHDGRTLAATRPGQTVPTTPPQSSVTAPRIFTLSSAAVGPGGILPDRFTCHAGGASPSLSWVAAPSAQQLALVVRDRNANGFVHWIVTGIDPTVTGFGEAATPEAATPQVNSTGALGWFPPCPPAGSGRHIYDFVLHALATPLIIDPAAPAADVAAQIEKASTGSATMSVAVDPGNAQPPGGSASANP